MLRRATALKRICDRQRVQNALFKYNLKTGSLLRSKYNHSRPHIYHNEDNIDYNLF